MVILLNVFLDQLIQLTLEVSITTIASMRVSRWVKHPLRPFTNFCLLFSGTWSKVLVQQFSIHLLQQFPIHTKARFCYNSFPLTVLYWEQFLQRIDDVRNVLILCPVIADRIVD